MLNWWKISENLMVKVNWLKSYCYLNKAFNLLNHSKLFNIFSFNHYFKTNFIFLYWNQRYQNVNCFMKICLFQKYHFCVLQTHCMEKKNFLYHYFLLKSEWYWNKLLLEYYYYFKPYFHYYLFFPYWHSICYTFF